MSSKEFGAKILLFGEYGLIRNSRGLALPYDKFFGELKFQSSNSTFSTLPIDQELFTFVKYLQRMSENGEHDIDLNLEDALFEIGQGLRFESTVPRGMGLGSSGALCAALYDRYGSYSRNEALTMLHYLKNQFTKMESYFHGKSSGIDPLISYLNLPVMINNHEISTADVPIYSSDSGGAIFLLGTGISRRTEPLVNIFLEKCNNSSFTKLCDDVLLPITNECINSFLKCNIDTLYEFFRELSDFQYRHFRPMIPKAYLDLWKKGLESEMFYLKLCGAGGGGFLLGITKDYGKIVRELLDSRGGNVSPFIHL